MDHLGILEDLFIKVEKIKENTLLTKDVISDLTMPRHFETSLESEESLAPR